MGIWRPNLNTKQRRNSRRPEKAVFVMDSKGKQTSAVVKREFTLSPGTTINGATMGTDYVLSGDKRTTAVIAFTPPPGQ
jgi:hypothetical protein